MEALIPRPHIYLLNRSINMISLLLGISQLLHHLLKILNPMAHPLENSLLLLCSMHEALRGSLFLGMICFLNTSKCQVPSKKAFSICLGCPHPCQSSQMALRVKIVVALSPTRTRSRSTRDITSSHGNVHTNPAPTLSLCQKIWNVISDQFIQMDWNCVTTVHTNANTDVVGRQMDFHEETTALATCEPAIYELMITNDQNHIERTAQRMQWV